MSEWSARIEQQAIEPAAFDKPSASLSPFETPQNLERIGRHILAQFLDGDDVERWLLTQPQIDLPIVHHFGPGIYIREMHVKAGTFLVGHRHRYAVTNILQKGTILLATDAGPVRLEAPALFVSQPGRKWGVALEDVIFQNIIPTDLTDVDEIIDFWVDKSDSWRFFKENKGRYL